MIEFDNMTPDEVRVLREHRAVKATQLRPVDSQAMVSMVVETIKSMVKLGAAVDPKNPVWVKLLAATIPV